MSAAGYGVIVGAGDGDGDDDDDDDDTGQFGLYRFWVQIGSIH